ncbi:hypothetical protein MO973_19675 [Paenibacillus sp. TRM 82003]|nr:hypothetical protein [Paenibacillus sp. TRM 82003]
MNIDGFANSFRLGNHNRVFADVFPIGKNPHSDNGMMVVGYLMKSDNVWEKHKVELRMKERQVALIVYHFDDAEINPYWKDAEVLFSWSQDGPSIVVTEEREDD